MTAQSTPNQLPQQQKIRNPQASQQLLLPHYQQIMLFFHIISYLIRIQKTKVAIIMAAIAWIIIAHTAPFIALMLPPFNNFSDLPNTTVLGYLKRSFHYRSSHLDILNIKERFSASK